MKESECNLEENPFINYLSSRYAMNARINVEKLWNWCHENNKSFFIMSLGCLMNAVNSVPQLKRRIHDGKVIEYDSLDGVSPIMNEDEHIYREMRVKTPQEFEDILQWHDYVKNTSNDILSELKKVITEKLGKQKNVTIIGTANSTQGDKTLLDKFSRK